MKLLTYTLFVILCLFCNLLNAIDKPAKGAPGAILQAKIGLSPDKVIPGTLVQIKVKVKNSGKVPSGPAKIQVRYALPKPLQKSPKSILFETEIADLAKLDPGQERLITFDKEHQLPTVADFIRYDWPMRQYQVVLLEGEKEHILGTLSITLSAYYYEGPAKSLQVALP